MFPRKTVSALAVALALSACSNNDNPLNPPVGVLRVANAISDSNPIDAEVEGLPSNINNIAFGTASGEKDVADGNYRVTLRTTTNAGQVSFTDDPVTVDKNKVTVVYAVGRIADSSQQAFFVESQDTVLDSSQSEAQFVHAASQHASALDIYVTAPGDALASAIPKATLTYKTSSSQVIYTPGNYRIRITPQGDPLTVLFDSGPSGVPFPAASAAQFAIMDNASNQIFLLVLTGDGGNHQVTNGSS